MRQGCSICQDLLTKADGLFVFRIEKAHVVIQEQIVISCRWNAVKCFVNIGYEKLTDEMYVIIQYMQFTFAKFNSNVYCEYAKKALTSTSFTWAILVNDTQTHMISNFWTNSLKVCQRELDRKEL